MGDNYRTRAARGTRFAALGEGDAKSAEMLKLIENGDVYAPAPLGRQSLLLLDGRIARIGAIDRRQVESLGVECEVIDATRCIVCPGLIDPHQHILGGSGERGFRSMTPEIFAEELASAGVTTVVGCLGVDVTMKNMGGLVGKAKSLREEGIDTYLWSGGYQVPPATLLQTIREDLLFVQEIIGAGEIAVSDERSMDPDPLELARIAHDANAAGMLAGKCGLTHFHVGDHEKRLAPLRNLIENFAVEPSWLYATHVERSEELMREAIELAELGGHIDIDVVEEELPRWLRFYLHKGGDPSRLTVSSDAAINSPRVLFEQLRSAIRDHKVAFEQAWALASANTARVLRLDRQGTLEVGKRGHLLILEEGSLDIVHMHSENGWMVRDASLIRHSDWLEGNKREIHLVGTGSGAH
jgi:beta-aspartyl-dipeptidase (metallo-type)